MISIYLGLSLLIFTGLSVPLLAKRSDGYISLPVTYYEDSLLLVKLDLGTPSQTHTFALDTGSSDLWILSPNITTECSTFCDTFDISSSSTWKSLNIAYDMLYVSGAVNGTMGTDVLTLAGKTLKEAPLAIIQEGDLQIRAIFGVGPTANENQNIKEYINVPKKMVSQGLINRNMFSLYAGTKDTTTGGALLFGAVDHAKFSGELTAIDCVPQIPGATLRSYWTNFNGLTLNTANLSKILLNKQITALFDSGTSVNTLPPFIYNYIVYEYFGVSSPGDTVPCHNNDTLTFQLDAGFEITVSMEDNIFDQGDGTCIIGFMPGDRDVNAVFGIPFLQRVYTVFDTENFKLYIAPAVQTSELDIEVVYKGTNLNGMKGKGLLVPSQTEISKTRATASPTSSTSSTTSVASKVTSLSNVELSETSSTSLIQPSNTNINPTETSNSVSALIKNPAPETHYVAAYLENTKAIQPTGNCKAE